MICGIAFGVSGRQFLYVTAKRNIEDRRIRRRASMNDIAFKGAGGTVGVGVPAHAEDASLGVSTHAARALRGGGDRRSSSAAERRSTTSMVPPQTGQVQCECTGVFAGELIDLFEGS